VIFLKERIWRNYCHARASQRKEKDKEMRTEGFYLYSLHIGFLVFFITVKLSSI
jgi:hypothetical protein